MTEKTLYSRGVKLTLDCNSSNRIIKPLAWAGYISGCDQSFVNEYTWNRGMPHVHSDGSLYKISDMDPIYDQDMIDEQIPRLRSLKRLLINEPECKIPSYDYSALDEVCLFAETKCVGKDLYRCNAYNEWELIEENSPTCTGNGNGNGISISMSTIAIVLLSVAAIIYILKKKGMM